MCNLYLRKKWGAPCLYLNQAATAVFLKQDQQKETQTTKTDNRTGMWTEQNQQREEGGNLNKCHSAITPAFAGLETPAEIKPLLRPQSEQQSQASNALSLFPSPAFLPHSVQQGEVRAEKGNHRQAAPTISTVSRTCYSRQLCFSSEPI